MKPRRLGRGLDFLLGSPETATAESNATQIELGQIEPNPWQPRSDFDEEALEELTSSIRRHGVVQPVLVRKKENGGFQLVAGERRFQAAKRAGLTAIPAVVRELDDRDMLVVALVENVQRRDLGALERARAFRRLADEQGLSHQEIAEAAGLARSTVTNSMRLLELDPESLQALQSGRITEGHARALLAESDPGRRATLLRKLLDEKLSVRSAEDERKSKGGAIASKTGTSANAEALERALREHLATKVQIKERGARGRIVLHYASLAEFDRLYTRLTGRSPEIE